MFANGLSTDVFGQVRLAVYWPSAARAVASHHRRHQTHYKQQAEMHTMNSHAIAVFDAIIAKLVCEASGENGLNRTQMDANRRIKHT